MINDQFNFVEHVASISKSCQVHPLLGLGDKTITIRTAIDTSSIPIRKLVGNRFNKFSWLNAMCQNHTYWIVKSSGAWTNIEGVPPWLRNSPWFCHVPHVTCKQPIIYGTRVRRWVQLGRKQGRNSQVRGHRSACQCGSYLKFDLRSEQRHTCWLQWKSFPVW